MESQPRFGMTVIDMWRQEKIQYIMIIILYPRTKRSVLQSLYSDWAAQGEELIVRADQKRFKIGLNFFFKYLLLKLHFNFHIYSFFWTFGTFKKTLFGHFWTFLYCLDFSGLFWAFLDFFKTFWGEFLELFKEFFYAFFDSFILFFDILLLFRTTSFLKMTQ